MRFLSRINKLIPLTLFKLFGRHFADRIRASNIIIYNKITTASEGAAALVSSARATREANAMQPVAHSDAAGGLTAKTAGALRARDRFLRGLDLNKILD
jgi:hypothetical protein